MSKKRRIIVIAIVVVMGGIIAAIIATHLPKKPVNPGSTAPTATIKIDKDTGEQIVTDPSIGTVESQDANGTTILGLADLIQADNLSSQQSNLVKDTLTTYAQKNLANKYSTLTIRPQDIVVKGDTITSTVRLGDSTTTVALRFVTGTTSGTMQVFVTDPSNVGGGALTSPATTVTPE